MTAERMKVIIYPIKCVLGLCIGYLLYKHFPQHQFYWSMISVLLVLAPDGNDSNKLVFDRIRATILGSSIGLILFLIYTPNLFLICIGIVATISIGMRFKLDNAIRSALVSLVIVMIQEQKDGTWKAAVERIVCVIIGCFIALLLTLIVNLFIQNEIKPVSSIED